MVCLFQGNLPYRSIHLDCVEVAMLSAEGEMGMVSEGSRNSVEGVGC